MSTVLPKANVQTPTTNYSSKTTAKSIIGSQGKDPGKFSHPTDVDFNQTNGQILVADCNNHRIQIFNSNDGRFCTSFGKTTDYFIFNSESFKIF